MEVSGDLHYSVPPGEAPAGAPQYRPGRDSKEEILIVRPVAGLSRLVMSETFKPMYSSYVLVMEP
jgi:hypothetical protein